VAQAASPSLLYLPDLGAAGSKLALPPDEAHYVARVCRARPGDEAEATDGRGALARLRFVAVGREVRAEVISVERSDRRRTVAVWCGAPERGRADWLVEKLAELGVGRFLPLDCEGESWPLGTGRAERWKRLAVAALRQSRRRFLLEIQPPAKVGSALETLEPGGTLWLADPAGGSPPAGDGADREVGVVGPSGGFRASERAQLEAVGFVPIRLADGRLRTETAAVGLASWLAIRSPGS
jgi:16S rRNA (uracil1498-N3)-methyltransferase